MNRHERQIVDEITDEHEKITLNPDVTYCQLTTQPGRISLQAVEFIAAQGCPVCHRGPHGNTDAGAVVRQAMRVSSPWAHPTTPSAPGPGPTIRLR
jgi:hypothetical protein